MITSQTYKRPCSCQEKTSCRHVLEADIMGLSAVVDAAARDVLVELVQQHTKGKRGWDSVSPAVSDYMKFKIEEVVQYGDLSESDLVKIMGYSVLLLNLEKEKKKKNNIF